jgi:hypothetical protein
MTYKQSYSRARRGAISPFLDDLTVGAFVAMDFQPKMHRIGQIAFRVVRRPHP